MVRSRDWHQVNVQSSQAPHLLLFCSLVSNTYSAPCRPFLFFIFIFFFWLAILCACSFLCSKLFIIIIIFGCRRSLYFLCLCIFFGGAPLITLLLLSGQGGGGRKRAQQAPLSTPLFSNLKQPKPTLAKPQSPRSEDKQTQTFAAVRGL